ncbi:Uncharacterised protein [Raoultella terrigena]|uniref:Cellulose biosynthesis protein BcsO n=1 Tax=Raoultella terrigena TaxID=577 RepID=A0A3P8JB51_RAOTE|nr:Uncharacterised protein [Raoultella terrigena]
MNHYDDLQRFKEKTRTQSLHFKDLSSQSAAREQGDWVILNQLAPGEKESSLAMGGSVSLPLPQQVPADTFLWVEAAPAQVAPEPTPPILTPEPPPAAPVVVPAAVAPSPVAQSAAPAEPGAGTPRCRTDICPCTGYSARADNEPAAIRRASSAAGTAASLGRLCALICDESR